jgi:60 kDa SS-A/Ro ribonucleoprotein
MSMYLEALQPKNNAGGPTNVLDCFDQFRRFLILGSESGTYYVKARQHTLDNISCLEKCAERDFDRTLNLIVEVSTKGLAPKNTPAIFALALLVKRDIKAIEVLDKVCRTSTHLFEFVQYINAMRGWGRALKRGIANWYLKKSPRDLAYQVTKYQSRGGMSHKKVMRLCHIPAKASYRSIVQYVINYDKFAEEKPKLELASFQILNNFELAKSAVSEDQIIHLIKNSELPWECIPTKWLGSGNVWRALVDRGMPITALIRNLGRLTANKAIKPFDVGQVAEQLTNEELLRKGRVHPYSILVASKMYDRGHSLKGQLEWTPINAISDALNVAFNKSFQYLDKIHQNTLIGLDVSGSMTSPLLEDGLISCAEAGAALIKAFLNVFDNVQVMAFDHQFRQLIITKSDSLASILSKTRSMSFGSTDCSLPMRYAQQAGLDVHNFVVITDNEHWYGQITPDQALTNYRQSINPKAKAIAVGMAATAYTIYNGPGTLNVVGFDSSVPSLISEFAND